MGLNAPRLLLRFIGEGMFGCSMGTGAPAFNRQFGFEPGELPP